MAPQAGEAYIALHMFDTAISVLQRYLSLWLLCRVACEASGQDDDHDDGGGTQSGATTSLNSNDSQSSTIRETRRRRC